jgi:hypothetical protein
MGYLIGMSNIFEQIRKPATILFSVIGIIFLLNDNYRNAAIAFAVAIMWTRQFDEFLSRLLGR